MKRVSSLQLVVLLAIGLTLLLTACGTDNMVSDAYTAAGDGTRPQDVTKTAVLSYDDDLNIVIVLNSHRRELEVSAIFTAPDGSTYGTDTIEADKNVSKVLLGLDWEAQNGVYWVDGEWKVDVMVDDDVEKTLTFTVAPVPETTSEG